MRASELVKRPVVTLAGDDVAQVKDLVYHPDGGELAGFTLNGRGLLAGPLHKALPWAAIHSCGRDAVIIRDESAMVEPEVIVDTESSREHNVLGAQVLTDSGTDLGRVVDVIVEVGVSADVVGYEIDSSPALNNDGRKVLLPLPDTMAVSGEALIVPATATEFVCDDLAGFGAAVDAFRARLRGSR